MCCCFGEVSIARLDLVIGRMNETFLKVSLVRRKVKCDAPEV